MVSCTAIPPLEHYQTPNYIACCSSIEGVYGRQKFKWVKFQVGHRDINVQRSAINKHLNALSHKLDRAIFDNSLINTPLSIAKSISFLSLYKVNRQYYESNSAQNGAQSQSTINTYIRYHLFPSGIAQPHSSHPPICTALFLP